jgi:hypothetical protein
MRRIALLAAAGAAATALLALTLPAASAGTAPGSVSASPPVVCTLTDPTGGSIGLTEADNGRTICVKIGQRVSVFLRVDPVQYPNRRNWWSPIRASGTALVDTTVPTPVALGVTYATFKGAAVGQSVLTSYRDICPPAPPYCGAPLLPWRVTANVTY